MVDDDGQFTYTTYAPPAPSLDEQRRLSALHAALTVTGRSIDRTDSASIITVAKEFEKYLKGEGE